MFALCADMSGHVCSRIGETYSEEEPFFENSFGHLMEKFVILFNDLVQVDRKRSYQNLVLLPFIFSNVLLAKSNALKF